jgi:glutathione S-transferase
VHLALRLKGIKYAYLPVASMMPRPFLRDTFGLTYRKIPVCIIGQELYCDTSIILEALEFFFPPSAGYASLYPPAADWRTYRPLIRGFASYWTDRPLFRVTTGLIPGSVWRTSFGVDRAGLIGHKLDPEKLEKKIPLNLSGLDLQLSLLEPLFRNKTGPWIFSTKTPSAADIALYYQLKWGNDIAAGRYIANLTGGGTSDTDTDGTTSVFNPKRYPGLSKWFAAFTQYIDGLPIVESTIGDEEGLEILKRGTNAAVRSDIPLLPTPAPSHLELDSENGLKMGIKVSVFPDDTGRNE